jgi:cation transport regulator ChaB
MPYLNVSDDNCLYVDRVGQMTEEEHFDAQCDIIIKWETQTPPLTALNLMNLSEDYTPKQLTKAYHNLYRHFHPDKNLTSPEKSTLASQVLAQAKEFLQAKFDTTLNIAENPFAKTNITRLNPTDEPNNLTAPIFIALCITSYGMANKVFDKNPTHIAGLFQTDNAFIKLCSAHADLAQKVFNIEPDRIAGLFQTGLRLVQLRKASPPLANEVFEKKPQYIAAWSQTAAQFILFCRLESAWHDNLSWAHIVFKESPQRIAELFTTSDEFIQLYKANSDLARKVFGENPQRIADLFTTSDAFIQLYKTDSGLAGKVFDENSQRIAELFTTSDAFIQLYKTDCSLARKVFDENSQRIAKLFQTPEDFKRLEKDAYLLSRDVHKENCKHSAHSTQSSDALMRLKEANSDLPSHVKNVIPVQEEEKDLHAKIFLETFKMLYEKKRPSGWFARFFTKSAYDHTPSGLSLNNIFNNAQGKIQHYTGARTRAVLQQMINQRSLKNGDFNELDHVKLNWTSATDNATSLQHRSPPDLKGAP